MLQRGILGGSNGRMHLGHPLHRCRMQPRTLRVDSCSPLCALKCRLCNGKQPLAAFSPRGPFILREGMLNRRTVKKLRWSESSNVVGEGNKVLNGEHHCAELN